MADFKESIVRNLILGLVAALIILYLINILSQGLLAIILFASVFLFYSLAKDAVVTGNNTVAAAMVVLMIVALGLGINVTFPNILKTQQAFSVVDGQIQPNVETGSAAINPQLFSITSTSVSGTPLDDLFWPIIIIIFISAAFALWRVYKK